MAKRIKTAESVVWQGNEDLRPLLAPIDSIQFDPHNARRHNDRNKQSIRKSLEKFGQQKPIVVDSQGVVRAGNGTLEQAKALGWTHIARTRSSLSDADLTAYALADNISADFADWDPDVLRDQLEDLDEQGFDLDAAGLALSDEDLADLIGDGDDEEEASGGGAGASGGSSARDNPSHEEQWKIVVTCDSESHQASLLEKFEKMRLTCRALIG